MGLAGEVGLAPCTVFISQGHTERSAARVRQKAGYISRTAGPSNGRKKKNRMERHSGLHSPLVLPTVQQMPAITNSQEEGARQCHTMVFMSLTPNSAKYVHSGWKLLSGQLGRWKMKDAQFGWV